MSFVLVRLETLNPGVSLSGKVRAIPANQIREHGALCAAFGLDPVRSKIDVPRSWGEAAAPGRIQQAMLFFHDGHDFAPLGHFTIMRDSERIPDDSPTDPRDFFNLSNRM